VPEGILALPEGMPIGAIRRLGERGQEWERDGKSRSEWHKNRKGKFCWMTHCGTLAQGKKSSMEAGGPILAGRPFRGIARMVKQIHHSGGTMVQVILY